MDNKSLKVLSLFANTFGEEGVAALGRLIACNRTLVRLNATLESSYGTPRKHLDAFAEALAANTAIRGVRLFVWGMPAMKQLSHMLPLTQTLQYLCVYTCGPEIEQLCAALAQNKSIQEVEINCYLNLDDGTALAHLFETTTTIQVVTITTRVKNTCLIRLFNGIARNSSIWWFSVQGGSLTSTACTAIAAALESNNTFACITLGRATAEDSCLKLVSAALERNFTLQMMRMNYSATSLPALEIRQRLRRNMGMMMRAIEFALTRNVVHFPPALYIHVTQELGKRLVLILNKVDLVPDTLTAAWIKFFQGRYPGLVVLPFASYAGMTAKGKRGKRQGRLRMASEACRGLLDACKDMVGDQVDLTSWKNKIEEELTEEAADDDDEEEHNALASAPTELVAPDTSFYEEERFKGGRLTLGFVGQPNVGKSSLLNALVGRKVVSVSRTPGHTKHFQTIFLTDNVRLCDCPGLVFPSLQPKALQVLTGCFPIAQLREPYSAIQYLAERLDLPGILKLPPLDGAGDTQKPWSAFDLCEAWAVERGYLTAKAGRPDAYRAANSLLRMALDGRTLCLAFRPQGSEVDSSLMARLARIRGEPPAKSASSESEQEESEDEDSEEEDEEEDHFQTNKFAALANDVDPQMVPLAHAIVRQELSHSGLASEGPTTPSQLIDRHQPLFRMPKVKSFLYALAIQPSEGLLKIIRFASTAAVSDMWPIIATPSGISIRHLMGTTIA
ncbi:hypothetical protein HPB51_019383 [Rhipicephalus microplus]|uniref:Guanine nucleotide-binding protein-like 1 n=1 Tax=Rhipicephalus microplus TaxID=6941 RepID=A0A9J6DBS9_RHIMP|nr:hypothetical protein HPB51_019383 [Rhipicephalus microplus]